MRAVVKPSICIVPLLIALASFAQRPDWRNRVDHMVREADSLSMKSQKIFYLNKFIGEDKPVKETWYYTLNNGRVLIFEVKYVLEGIEHSEIYYLDKNDLICMEQYEVPYLSVYTDEVKKGGAYFFVGNDLKEFVLTGRQNPDDFKLSNGYGLYSRFEKRYKELKETLTLQR